MDIFKWKNLPFSNRLIDRWSNRKTKQNNKNKKKKKEKQKQIHKIRDENQNFKWNLAKKCKILEFFTRRQQQTNKQNLVAMIDWNTHTNK